MLLDGKAPKDQVAHWYEAQLIHYGLQRSKGKNTAKVRLQQALSQRKLTVSAHIVEIEVQMKKKYAASIKKARSAADRAARVGSEDSVVSAARKRKQSKADPELGIVASKKTKITMKVGDLEVSIEHDLPGTTSTGTSREIAKGKTFSSDSTMASPLTKGKAANTPASTRKPPKTPQSRRTLHQNLQSPSVPAFTPSVTPTLSVISPSRVSTPQQTRVKAEPKVKKEPTAGYSSSSRAPPKIKAEVNPRLRPSHARAAASSPVSTTLHLHNSRSSMATKLTASASSCASTTSPTKFGAVSSLYQSPEYCALTLNTWTLTPRCLSVGELETRTVEVSRSEEAATETSSSSRTGVSPRLCSTCSRSRSSSAVKGDQDRCGAGGVPGSSSAIGRHLLRRRVDVELGGHDRPRSRHEYGLRVWWPGLQ